MVFGAGEPFTHLGRWEDKSVEQENRALPGLGNSSPRRKSQSSSAWGSYDDAISGQAH